MPRPSAHVASSLALCFTVIACKSDAESTSGTAGATSSAPSTTSPPSDPKAEVPKPPVTNTPAGPAFDTIAPHAMSAMGPQPGFVAGGTFYAAARVGAVVPWLRSIPLGPAVARDVAEMSADTRVDWRAEDLQRRFSLATDATLSITLFRPVDTEVDQLRGELTRSDSVIEAVKRAFDARSKAEKPPMLPEGAPAPTPMALTDVELEHGRNLASIADGLALHSRFAVGVTDPNPLLEYARGFAALEPEWRDACSSLGDVVCIGDGDVVFAVHATKTEVVGDLLMFVVDEPVNSPTARKVLADAIAIASDGRDHGMRGEASAEVDAAAIVRVGMLDATRGSLSTMRWNDPDRVTSIKSNFDEAVLLAELGAAQALFSGARLDIGIAGDDLFAELRWLPVAGQADVARAAFETTAPDSEVPALGPLCDGAIFCFRTAGLPRPTTLATRLGVGPYSGGFDALEDRVHRLDDVWVMHMFAASWPNVLASIAREPQIAAGGGPAGAMVGNLVDAIGRTTGAGGSVRTAGIHEGRLFMEYATYLRTTAADSAIPRGLMSVVGEPMSDVTLSGGHGTAAMLKIPEDVPPMTLMTIADPPAKDGATTLGWVAMVDAPERLSWLLGLAREKRGGPAAYAALPDLARLLPVLTPIFGDLEFSRAWTERRGLKASLELEDATPIIRAELSRPK